MLSFTTPRTYLSLSSHSCSDLTPHYFPTNLYEPSSRKKKKRVMALHFVAAKDSGSLLGFLDARNRSCREWFWSFGGFTIRCKKGWDIEGHSALEAEILEFMKNSDKPTSFPTKKQLVDAGRMDLVEGILKQGGWLTSGWDLNDGVNEEIEERVLENDGDKERKNVVVEDNVLESNEEWSHQASSSFGGSYPPASPSVRSLEAGIDNDSGIEGILSHLEKERNINFGLDLGERAGSTCVQRNDLEHDLQAKSSKNITIVVAAQERNDGPASSSPNGGIIDDSEGKFSCSTSLSNIDAFENSLKPDAWRTWSIRRAGFSEKEFEAAEFISCGTRMGGAMEDLRDEILETLETREGATASSNSVEGNSTYGRINTSQIRSRLQHLESNLSSVLNSLKSNTDENASGKVHESSSDELLKLSDASEFQENEIMDARTKLRSIRAKLAILEGKMTLAVLDVQRIMDEKQKRVDHARRALRLLRSACIVWPNSASEVLLAGSYDGWTTKRKMERSKTGIFSVCLKLYPGKYQIKFVVDGEWRIDPLRPMVHYDGYENNLLIIK